jgi:hypothetical protein
LPTEPGYYESGNFGIRIENVLAVKEAKTEKTFNGKKYYGFDTISLVRSSSSFCHCSPATVVSPSSLLFLASLQVPIQAKLIDKSLLSKDETEWFVFSSVYVASISAFRVLVFSCICRCVHICLCVGLGSTLTMPNA